MPRSDKAIRKLNVAFRFCLAVGGHDCSKTRATARAHPAERFTNQLEKRRKATVGSNNMGSVYHVVFENLAVLG